MNHLEEFKVMFLLKANRNKVVDGVLVPYYRITFSTKDGKVKGAISNSEDIAGKAGIVRFCKAGEDTPTGEKVHADCFSLVGYGDGAVIAGASNALDVFETAIGA